MHSIIEQLRVLNDLDVRLQSIQRDLERLPKTLEEREQELKALREQIERRKEEVKRLRADADAMDLELKSGMDTLKRLASQLNVLRTSKEFDVVRRQMDAQRVWNSQIEDKALALMNQADEKQKDVEQLGEQLSAQEQALAAERARVEKDLEELKAQQTGLAGQRKELAKEVPDKELAIYDRIVVNRGQAIATVNASGYCSACHMKLPPQIHNLALLAQELVTCPSCMRILTAKLNNAGAQEETQAG
jgi:hypothetical protein